MYSIKLRIGLSSIQNAMACISILYLYGGLFDYIPVFTRTMAYFVYAAWLFLSITTNKSFINRLFNNGWPIYLMLCLNFIVSVFAPNSHIVENRAVFLYICVIHSISVYYLDDGKTDGRRLILLVLMINFVFILVRSFFALRTNPMVARYLGAGLERYGRIVYLQSLVGNTNNISVEQVKGIGSYGFFNGLVFFQIPILLYAQKQERRTRRLLAYGLLIVTVVVSTMASFVMSMMLSIMLIVFLAVRKQRKKDLSVLFLSITMMFLLFTLTGLTSKMLLFFADSINNETISERMNELAYFLSGNLEETRDISSRINLYSMSIMSFIGNPFFGTIGKTRISGLIGGHATGIDVFGLYGISGLFYWKFWKNEYNRIKRYLPYDTAIYLNVAALYLVAILLLNSVTAVQIFSGAMLVLPFGFKYIYEKGEAEICKDC